MTTFLIRSTSDPKGYTTIERPDGTLPRTPAESYVPWAMTNHFGKVVYAKHGEHQSWRGGGSAQGPSLVRYDTSVSQNRRKLAESELGLFALNIPSLTSKAIEVVSQGIRRYHDALYVTSRPLLVQTIYDLIGSYFYTGGGKGFGRISVTSHKTMPPDAVRRGIIGTLSTGTVDQKLSIHDAFGRKILVALGGGPLSTYTYWGPILRQDWFDNKAKRGRVDRRGATPTTAGGIVPMGPMTGAVGTTMQARNRGVDMFQRDAFRTPEPAANEYYDDLDTRNLLFGAGISGTTGTLLQSAFAFGGVLRGEMLKQYVLGVVGYLVGGGMHSYHESMAVALKAGLSYTPGSYLTSLPQSFLSSHQCRDWSAKYYDIVHLGATHWRFNAPSMPSHLNPKLGNRPPPG